MPIRRPRPVRPLPQAPVNPLLEGLRKDPPKAPTNPILLEHLKNPPRPNPGAKVFLL